MKSFLNSSIGAAATLLLSAGAAAVVLTQLFFATATVHAQSDCTRCVDSAPKNGQDAWTELIHGNRRFRGIDAPRDRMNNCRRECTIGKQNPFAVVLACSDSRVPPEITFDQRIGDLFVVRVAGNVATDEGIGSIEYAITHLNKPNPPKILVVLGHQECGAVKAALEPPPNELLPSVLHLIYPAIQNQDLDPKKKEDVKRAVLANIDLTIRSLLSHSPVIQKAVNGGLRIQGAYYSLEDGSVTAEPATEARR